MKVLLTGGLGYIGSHTCIELINAGYTPIIADDCSNSKPEVINRIKTITGETVQHYNIDVADYDSLDKMFSEHEFFGVIHFAGYKAVGESVEKPLMYYRNNLDTTLTLLEVMKKYNVTNIVFSSSATVYGAAEVVPLVEGMPTGCTNPYGWTKYMIEQILTDVAYADKGFTSILLRYFNPIGANESGLIGEDPKGIPNNLIPFVTQVAVGKLPQLSVFGSDYDTPDGTGVRDYIHVEDLAKGHVCAIEYAKNFTGTEIFNLGTGIGYSVLDIVNTFQKVNNVPVPYAIKERRAGDVGTVYANAQKAFEKMGWKANKNLEDMCRTSWNWQKNNPNGYNVD